MGVYAFMSGYMLAIGVDTAVVEAAVAAVRSSASR